jgi:Tfp pilus assembly protein PilF
LLFKCVSQSDPEKAENLLHAAIKNLPNDPTLLGSYANFLRGVPGRHHEAEALYRQAIEAEPERANTLGNYATFLRNMRGRHDEADAIFQRAINADPRHANNLGNYANFLYSLRGRHDEAEDLYQRAIEADPKHANNLGNYANFMRSARGRYDKAEAIYRRAIEINPSHANSLGNLAQLVLARGEREEGRGLIDRAFAAEPPPPLQLELWFYRYAHFLQDYPEAVEAIEALLAEGVRSPGWDLSITLAQAAREGHPDPVRLEALAVRLASDPPTAAGEASDAH